MHIEIDKITFVVPVYNPDLKYFGMCLDSLAHQTYSNYDVILVNDGSTNGAEVLCSDYADANDNFTVINRENKGVSAARNAGISYINGSKWITFIDSDDRIREDSVEFLTEYLKEKEEDIIFFGSVKCDGNSESVHCPLSYEESESLGAEEKREILLDLIAEGFHKKGVPEGFLNVWSKVFRTEFLKENGIFFNEKMTVAEDVTFLIECMLKEQNGVAYVKEPLYIRQIDPTSAGHRYHPEIVENDREFLKNLKDLVGDSFDEDITKAMRKRYVVCLIGVAKFDMCHRDNPKKFGERVQDLKRLAGKNPYRVGINKCELKDFSKKNQMKIMLLRCHMESLFVLEQDVKRRR